MAEETLEEKVLRNEPESVEITAEGLGPWSCSKLKVAEQCPLNLYLKYVVKLKHPPKYSLVTDVGKAVHRILEFVVMGKTITEAFAATRREFRHMPDEVWEENLLSTEFSITEFRTRLDSFEKQHDVKRYVQELKVGFTREYEPTGFFADDVFFRGVLDLGIQMGSGDLVILDHKTGAPALMGIRNFQTQLNTYKVLFHKGVEEIEGAQAGIHFVRDGKILLDDYTDKTVIEGKLVRELEHNLQGVVDRINDFGYFKKIRGGHCKWCDYNEVCKRGELSGIEADTRKYFPIKPVET